MREYREEMRSRSSEGLDLLAEERRVQELSNGWAREAMAEVLRRADTTAPEVEIAGQRWGNRRIHRGEYHTTFGPMTIERSVYQQSGRGRVAIPVDLQLGIIEGTYTPRMARIATRAIALMPEDEAAAFLSEVGIGAMSGSTVGRLSRSLAARYENDRPRIAEIVRSQDAIPQGAQTVQVSLDGVMVPQDGEYAKPRGRETESTEPPRYETRYGPVGRDAPADHDHTAGRSWHEAGVGTLAFFDADGERLRTIYVARMPEAHKATLAAELEAELGAVLSERHDMNIVFASDGAEPQWQTLEAIESRLPDSFTGHTMKLVDAFHVAEYLQKAANAIFGTDTGDAKVQAATWREMIKEQKDGPERVLRSMRARLPQVRGTTAKKELSSAITYVARQHSLERMQYVDAQKRDYPIGTGVTEAAAKTIVGTRMKRAGARFSQHGGQTVMLFRAALLSQRFDALHRELHATYTKPVALAA